MSVSLLSVIRIRTDILFFVYFYYIKLRDMLRDLSTEIFRIFKGFPVLNDFQKSLINDAACMTTVLFVKVKRY